MAAAPPPTSTIRVRDELRHAIVEGVLAPGERLRSEALAERFGTSRTPIREALLLLEREGLVEIEPHKGAVVGAFDAADVRDLYEVRALIEPHAAARAATRVTPEALIRLAANHRAACAREADVDEQIALNEEFHRIVLEAAGSPRLTAAMRAVSGIPRPFRAVFWASEAQRAQSLFCHGELVSALRAGRPELAEAVMRTHILGARDFLREVSHG